ncbi:MAG TPA: MlaD family protein, partial [Novosphingobium sp.]|nr:MlaD family protein [Novosphingobium sp.]
EGVKNDYDIFFRQSVEGLGRGSAVTYAGVPAGKVVEIELWKKDPSLVRVRIAVDDRIPILAGTTASLQGSFTGVSTIQLNDGVKGAPPITAPGPEGVPEIPTKRSGLGALLSNAPVLMDRLTSLTERLGQVLSDQNIAHIDGVFANTDKMTRGLAEATPQLRTDLADLDATLQQATQTLTAFQKVADSANAQLDPNGPSLVHQMRQTLKSAQAAADALHGELDEARPATHQLATSTLPQTEATLRDLRETSRALREITEKIDNQGASGLLGAPKLPEYKP